jgi:hypothetical protein
MHRPSPPHPCLGAVTSSSKLAKFVDRHVGAQIQRNATMHRNSPKMGRATSRSRLAVDDGNDGGKPPAPGAGATCQLSGGGEGGQRMACARRCGAGARCPTHAGWQRRWLPAVHAGLPVLSWPWPWPWPCVRCVVVTLLCVCVRVCMCAHVYVCTCVRVLGRTSSQEPAAGRAVPDDRVDVQVHHVDVHAHDQGAAAVCPQLSQRHHLRPRLLEQASVQPRSITPPFSAHVQCNRLSACKGRGRTGEGAKGEGRQAGEHDVAAAVNKWVPGVVTR